MLESKSREAKKVPCEKKFFFRKTFALYLSFREIISLFCEYISSFHEHIVISRDKDILSRLAQ